MSVHSWEIAGRWGDNVFSVWASMRFCFFFFNKNIIHWLKVIAKTNKKQSFPVYVFEYTNMYLFWSLEQLLCFHRILEAFIAETCFKACKSKCHSLSFRAHETLLSADIHSPCYWCWPHHREQIHTCRLPQLWRGRWSPYHIYSSYPPHIV